MLVCSISQRRRRAAILADLAEAAAADDATTIGNIVFATLVDDPASVIDRLDAYLGEVMLEAANADTVLDASIPATYAADVAEAATAADVPSATIGPTMSAEAAAFLARTSGLDTTHTNAYAALIDGLVADSVWSKLDALYVYATQDSTTAALNLVSSTYNATVNGAPTFTADRGFTGTAGSTTKYINTGFNPSTATSPKLVQNSAHFSVWVVTNVANEDQWLGVAATNHIQMIPRYNTNAAFYFVNTTTNNSAGVSTTAGHTLTNRSASNAQQFYKNGGSISTDSSASTGVPVANIYGLAVNNAGTANGSGLQHAAMSFGSSLSATEAGNFYNRLRTFMTAVGVP